MINWSKWWKSLFKEDKPIEEKPKIEKPKELIDVKVEGRYNLIIARNEDIDHWRFKYLLGLDYELIATIIIDGVEHIVKIHSPRNDLHNSIANGTSEDDVCDIFFEHDKETREQIIMSRLQHGVRDNLRSYFRNLRLEDKKKLLKEEGNVEINIVIKVDKENLK